MDIQNFFSWELATTVSGVAIMVYVLLSVLREFVFMVYAGPKTPLIEKCLTYVLSLGIIFVVILQSNSPTWADYVLGVLNAGVVALAVDKMKEAKDMLALRQAKKMMGVEEEDK